MLVSELWCAALISSGIQHLLERWPMMDRLAKRLQSIAANIHLNRQSIHGRAVRPPETILNRHIPRSMLRSKPMRANIMLLLQHRDREDRPMPPSDTNSKPLVIVSSRDAGFSLTHRHILTVAGYSTDLSSDLEDVMLIAGGRAVDAVLLDAPDIGAATFCQGLKRQISSTRTAVVALLRAKAVGALPAILRAGADEVLICPVEPQQYLNALKHHLADAPTGFAVASRVTSGGLSVDTASHQAYWRGIPFHLSLIEFRLLSTLLHESGRVFSRRDLIERAWPAGVFVDPRTVNVHVARLRKALLRLTGIDWIRAVRGVGYGLALPGPRQDHTAYRR
ncbi:response regulator transcription factor (plasmid) [Ensifer adhaerens]|uniref:winged helix-turn-helix transcriptional regulator n=1 Tax=Ensifer adhaerens TaxID=106592 RepID=UPI0023A918E1|nr:response regulator transcription factor [Ensifer adhaerens]WDZ82010.1 response regulator transcription factor [Ensifer adhaerens]